MFDNFFWQSDDVEEVEEKWEEVFTVNINVPSRLMLRGEHYAVENQDGEKINIEGDDYLLMYKVTDAYVEENVETGEYRVYVTNGVGEREYLEDETDDQILDKVNSDSPNEQSFK